MKSRPSYLRVRSLMPLIDPKSVLALTATAGPMVVRDICSALCIPHVDPNPNECPSPSLSLTPSDGSNGVQLLDCKRDNIDVISLVLHNHDERRYLVRLHCIHAAWSPNPKSNGDLSLSAPQDIDGQNRWKRTAEESASRRRLP